MHGCQRYSTGRPLWLARRKTKCQGLAGVARPVENKSLREVSADCRRVSHAGLEGGSAVGRRGGTAHPQRRRAASDCATWSGARLEQLHTAPEPRTNRYGHQLSRAVTHPHTRSGAPDWGQSRNKVLLGERERAGIVENFSPNVGSRCDSLLPDCYNVEWLQKVSVFSISLQLFYISYKIIISRLMWLTFGKDFLDMNKRHFPSGFPERNRILISNWFKP